MLLQRAGTGTLPPTGFVSPLWEVLAEASEAAPEPETATVTLGPEDISLGHDDDEADDDTKDVMSHEFGWDNEHPKRTVHVDQFRIEWRPVTNGQFYDFWMSGGKDIVQFPKSWVDIDGVIYVSGCFQV